MGDRVLHLVPPTCSQIGSFFYQVPVGYTQQLVAVGEQPDAIHTNIITRSDAPFGN